MIQKIHESSWLKSSISLIRVIARKGLNFVSKTLKIRNNIMNGKLKFPIDLSHVQPLTPLLHDNIFILS